MITTKIDAKPDMELVQTVINRFKELLEKQIDRLFEDAFLIYTCSMCELSMGRYLGIFNDVIYEKRSSILYTKQEYILMMTGCLTYYFKAIKGGHAKAKSFIININYNDLKHSWQDKEFVKIFKQIMKGNSKFRYEGNDGGLVYTYLIKNEE